MPAHPLRCLDFDLQNGLGATKAHTQRGCQPLAREQTAPAPTHAPCLLPPPSMLGQGRVPPGARGWRRPACAHHHPAWACAGRCEHAGKGGTASSLHLARPYPSLPARAGRQYQSSHPAASASKPRRARKHADTPPTTVPSRLLPLPCSLAAWGALQRRDCPSPSSTSRACRQVARSHPRCACLPRPCPPQLLGFGGNWGYEWALSQMHHKCPALFFFYHLALHVCVCVCPCRRRASTWGA